MHKEGVNNNESDTKSTSYLPASQKDPLLSAFRAAVAVIGLNAAGLQHIYKCFWFVRLSCCSSCCCLFSFSLGRQQPEPERLLQSNIWIHDLRLLLLPLLLLLLAAAVSNHRKQPLLADIRPQLIRVIAMVPILGCKLRFPAVVTNPSLYLSTPPLDLFDQLLELPVSWSLLLCSIIADSWWLLSSCLLLAVSHWGCRRLLLGIGSLLGIL